MTNPRRTARVPHTLLGLLTALVLAGCGSPAVTPASEDLQLEATQAELMVAVTPQQVGQPRPFEGSQVIMDPGASGGSAVILLSTHQTVTFKLPNNLKAQEYTVSIVGRGEQYMGPPQVSLSSVDGPDRIVTLDNTQYEKRSFGRMQLSPGGTITLTFVNDLYNEATKQDRNAVVDYLQINQSKSGT